jgi:hypothetical protein
MVCGTAAVPTAERSPLWTTSARVLPEDEHGPLVAQQIETPAQKLDVRRWNFCA